MFLFASPFILSLIEELKKNQDTLKFFFKQVVYLKGHGEFLWFQGFYFQIFNRDNCFRAGWTYLVAFLSTLLKE